MGSNVRWESNSVLRLSAKIKDSKWQSFIISLLFHYYVCREQSYDDALATSDTVPLATQVQLPASLIWCDCWCDRRFDAFCTSLATHFLLLTPTAFWSVFTLLAEWSFLCTCDQFTSWSKRFECDKVLHASHIFVSIPWFFHVSLPLGTCCSFAWGACTHLIHTLHSLISSWRLSVNSLEKSFLLSLSKLGETGSPFILSYDACALHAIVCLCVFADALETGVSTLLISVFAGWQNIW